MSTSQRLMKWASQIHLARLEANALRKKMAAFQCQHELAANYAEYGFPLEKFHYQALRMPDGSEYQLTDKDRAPCWKGEEVESGNGYPYPPMEWQAFGDERPGGWCDPCEAREKLRPAYAAAKSRLAHLKGTLWGFAARAHAELEAELDEAGKS